MRRLPAALCGFGLLVFAAVCPAQDEEVAVRVFNAVQPSVVGLESVSSSGTGIILDAQGHILTNAHVVALPLGFKCLVDAQVAGKSQTLVFSKVQMLGVHPTLDLALLKIDPAEHKITLPPAKVLKAKAQTGQRVYAIGNPGASGGVNLSKTITEGLLSGVDRVIEDIPYYQFSAAINPGNSGGPLCDKAGNVIGLVTLKRSDLEGVGFAIPLHELKREEFKPLTARKGDPAKAGKLIDAGNTLIDELTRLERAGRKGSLQAEFLQALALQMFHEALVVEPANASIYNVIGDLLTEFEEYDQAEPYFIRALELEPWGKDARIYRAYAKLKIKQKKLAEAETIMLEGLAKYPTTPRQLWEDMAIDSRDAENWTRAATYAALGATVQSPETRIDVCRGILGLSAQRETSAEKRTQVKRQLEFLSCDLYRRVLRRNEFLAAKRLAITKGFADLMAAKGAHLDDGRLAKASPVQLSWLDTNVTDLLANGNPVGAGWKVEGGSATSSAAANAVLSATTATIPEQYDLYVEVERLSGQGELVVGFPFQKQLAMLIVDFGGTKSGLSGVRDGLYSQPVLPARDPVSLVLRVRGQQLSVAANDAEILFRTSAAPLPAPSAAWKVPTGAAAFVGSNKASFHVHGWWLLPPAAEGQTVALAAGSSGFGAASGLPGGGPRPVIPDRPSVFSRPMPSFGTPASNAPAANVKTYDAKEVMKISSMGWGTHALAFSPDAKFIAAGKADDAVQVFDVASGGKIAEHSELRDVGDVKCIAFTPQGDKLLAGGDQGKIAVWDFTATRSLKPARPFLGHSGELAALRISKDGKFVLSGGRDKRVRYWELATAKEQAAFALDDAVLDVAFAADGKTAYACDKAQVYHLNLTSGETDGTTPQAASYASVAALARDGSLAACADSRKVRVAGVTQPRDAGNFDTGQTIFGLAFSPDAGLVFAGSSGGINVFDLRSQQALGMVPVGEVINVNTITVSADGRLVAAVPSAAGQAIQIFELPKP